jgi:hypothetical protein
MEMQNNYNFSGKEITHDCWAGYSRLLNYRRGLRFIRLLLEVEPTNRWEAELNQTNICKNLCSHKRMMGGHIRRVRCDCRNFNLNRKP